MSIKLIIEPIECGESMIFFEEQDKSNSLDKYLDSEGDILLIDFDESLDELLSDEDMKMLSVILNEAMQKKESGKTKFADIGKNMKKRELTDTDFDRIGKIIERMELLNSTSKEIKEEEFPVKPSPSEDKYIKEHAVNLVKDMLNKKQKQVKEPESINTLLEKRLKENKKDSACGTCLGCSGVCGNGEDKEDVFKKTYEHDRVFESKKEMHEELLKNLKTQNSLIFIESGNKGVRNDFMDFIDSLPHLTGLYTNNAARYLTRLYETKQISVSEYMELDKRKDNAEMPIQYFVDFLKSPESTESPEDMVIRIEKDTDTDIIGDIISSLISAVSPKHHTYIVINNLNKMQRIPHIIDLLAWGKIKKAHLVTYTDSLEEMENIYGSSDWDTIYSNIGRYMRRDVTKEHFCRTE